MTKPKGAPINRDRRVDYLPLTGLKAAKRNAKDHDVGAIHDSFSQFGYVENITMDERTGRLIAGHGRLETLTKLMIANPTKPPEGVKIGPDGSWMLPIARGWASKNDQQAEAYLIASNRTSELGGWHKDILADTLSDLAGVGKLDGTGYDGDDVDRLLKSLGDPLPVDFKPQQECQVLVTCKSEKEQAELLMRLTKEGFTVRSLIA